MLVVLDNVGQVVESKLHGGVVDFVSEDNVAAVGKGAVATHLNKVLVISLDLLNRFAITGSPVVGVEVPEDGGKIQLGGDPTDTVVNITESLYIIVDLV